MLSGHPFLKRPLGLKDELIKFYWPKVKVSSVLSAWDNGQCIWGSYLCLQNFANFRWLYLAVVLTLQ